MLAPTQTVPSFSSALPRLSGKTGCGKSAFPSVACSKTVEGLDRSLNFCSVLIESVCKTGHLADWLRVVLSSNLLVICWLFLRGPF